MMTHKDIVHIKREDLLNLLKYRLQAKTYTESRQNIKTVAKLIKNGVINTIEDLEKTTYDIEFNKFQYDLKEEIEERIMNKIFGDD